MKRWCFCLKKKKKELLSITTSMEWRFRSSFNQALSYPQTMLLLSLANAGDGKSMKFLPDIPSTVAPGIYKLACSSLNSPFECFSTDCQPGS